MPRWFIDFSVWCLIVVGIVSLSAVVFNFMRPPTYTEVQAAARADSLRQCRQAVGSERLPAAMVDRYCDCIASERSTFFGVTQDTAISCRQSTARLAASDPRLEEAFAEAFPAFCQRVETLASQRDTAVGSPYCGCLEADVRKDKVRMAQYAFASGEPDTKARRDAYDKCVSLLDFGSGWHLERHDEFAQVQSSLPSFFDAAATLRFTCRGGDLGFEALTPSGDPIVAEAAFYDEMGAVKTLRTGDTGMTVRQVVDELRFTDQVGNTRPAVTFGVGETAISLTVAGFREQTETLLTLCPLPELRTVAVSTDLPDLWEQTSGGSATIKDYAGLGWTANLVCDDGPLKYLALASSTFEGLGQEYPDPSGDFHAAGVPILLNGHAVAPPGAPCTSGQGGAEETCYATLDGSLLAHLAEGAELQATVGDQPLSSVRFASSAAVAAILPSCLAD